jgi:hypothetical protein
MGVMPRPEAHGRIVYESSFYPRFGFVKGEANWHLREGISCET